MLKITSTYPRATKVLEIYKKYVVSQAKRNLKSKGDLHSSIKGYVTKKFNRSVSAKFLGGSSMPSVRFELNDYGVFQDQGVKGTSPVDNRHASKTGNSIFGRQGRFRKSKKALPIKAIKDWSEKRGLNPYAVARSVHKKGITKTLFFSKPFMRRYQPMLKQYHEAVSLDIAHNIGNQIVKQLKKKK